MGIFMPMARTVRLIIFVDEEIILVL